MSVTDAIASDLLIGGDRTPPDGGEYFPVLDPASGVVLRQVARGGAVDVERAVQSARAAYDEARRALAPVDRSRILSRTGHLLLERLDEIGELESRDTGKPLTQATADVRVAARYFEFYAGLADKLDGRSIPLAASMIDWTVREPHGVCGIITPWNYPLQIGARSLAPAIGAGNAVVLKPAEEAPLSSLLLAELLSEAGLPAGMCNVVTGFGEEAGAALTSHPGLDHVTFTGSGEVATEVMVQCAKHIRPVTLELGGKTPHVVCADADLDRALPIVMNSIYQHAGQTCTAGSRLIVEREAHDRWVEAIVGYSRRLTIGPGIEDHDLGSLVSLRQRQRVQSYVDDAVRDGAQVAVGGRAPSDARLQDGAFFEPTVLVDVRPEMRVAQEEVFGPVLAVIAFADGDLAQAAATANGTPYGLAAGVWSASVDKCMSLARDIRAGQVYINTFGAGGGVELPSGGFGRSGIGREKGLEGILAYTSVKNVCVEISPEHRPPHDPRSAA